jgi:lipopolysaccharide export system protein LptA
MTMRRSLLVGIALGLGGAAALAQEPVSALRGHDSNAPVDVSANRIEVHERADRAIFVGDVRVRQASLTLDTQRLTVAYQSAGGIQIERLDASGGVTVRSPSETATGNFRHLRLAAQADHARRRCEA